MFVPEPGTIIAKRYHLERTLGTGGMGTVWVARDTKLRRPVAVKMMAAHVATKKKAAARFEREAMAAAKVRSPYIVEVHDYGIHEGRPFMVQELLEGETLSGRIRRGGPLSVLEVAQLASQVGKALTTAHQAGIVHRDLKAGNIFLVRDEEDQIAKVFDFGIAKALTETSPREKLTTDGDILGTPGYMSPEQLRGEGPIDHRTDLWSLGVILYRALTARMPFVGEDAGMLVASILADRPQFPSEVAPDLPRELDLFFERALAKEPDDRFQTGRELSAAFARAADVRPSRPSLPMVEPIPGEEDQATPTPPSLSTSTKRSGGWLEKHRRSSPPTGDTATAVTRTPTPLHIPMKKGRLSLWLGAAAAVALGGALAAYLAGDAGSAGQPPETDSAPAAATAAPNEAPADDTAAPDEEPPEPAAEPAVATDSPEPTVSTSEAPPAARPTPATTPAWAPPRPATATPYPHPRPAPTKTQTAQSTSSSDLFSEPW